MKFRLSNKKFKRLLTILFGDIRPDTFTALLPAQFHGFLEKQLMGVGSGLEKANGRFTPIRGNSVQFCAV